MPNKIKKEQYILICPKCNSDDVTFEKNPAYIGTGLFNQFSECLHCGHHGMFFPQFEKSKIPKKIKPINELKDRNLAQTSIGKGYFFYFKYLEIPLLIMFVLLIILFILGTMRIR